ncbi:MAG: Holliday junction branch migration protein RuvA [Acidobacteriota bacterium]
MIARLSGTLVEKTADRVIVDVRGVGYDVRIPFSTYYELGDVGSDVTLRIYTHVKEEVFSLHGFLTAKEKRLFTALIQISGIGPKLGMAILSGLPVDELAEAVLKGDLVRLSGIPGVGKKTAERMVLELKGQIGKLLPDSEVSPSLVSGALQGDVVSALVNLGYPKGVAERAVSDIARSEKTERLDVLLRAALRRIAK